MQGDAVAILIMGVGTPRVAATAPVSRKDLCEEIQCHRKRFTRGDLSGYHRGVLPCPSPYQDWG